MTFGEDPEACRKRIDALVVRAKALSVENRVTALRGSRPRFADDLVVYLGEPPMELARDLLPETGADLTSVDPPTVRSLRAPDT